MYLNLGGTTLVRKRDIIGIFDLDRLEAGSSVMDFLRSYEEKKLVTVVGDGIPKAFVLTRSADTEKIYITTLSAASLRGRNGV